MIEKYKKESTLLIISGRTCLCARGRAKRCRFAPINAFIPRTGAGIAHCNVPRTTTKAKKERKARTGTAILFFKKKTRRRRNVKARIFIKVSPRERLIKKAYQYRAENMKKLRRIKNFECQTRRRLDKTPVCPTVLQFFGSLLTEGSSVRTRQGEPRKSQVNYDLAFSMKFACASEITL